LRFDAPLCCCCRRGQYVYDTSKFHNRVVSLEMVDHHPPRLELMAPFCREVHEYLEADPRNVVAGEYSFFYQKFV
jgi:phosphatidylinositol-3,4,5-trisphosphate 3-phosphatase/dual-specificity protein phosphatase PTEN